MIRWAAAAAATALVLAGLPAHADTPTWTPTFPVQGGAEERIEVGSDGALWAVIDHSRVLRSLDHGQTWVQATPPSLIEAASGVGGPPAGGSSDTSVAPLSATVALAANANSLSETRDGGVTWLPRKLPTVTRPGGLQDVQVLRRLHGRYWAGMGGSDLVGDCPRWLPTTPLLSSADGVHWTRSDIRTPSGSFRSLTFADARHGAASVYDFHWEVDGCGYGGSSNSTGVWVTDDGGRSWARRFTCLPSCTVAWGSLRGQRRLTAVRADGVVLDSLDDGRHTRRTATLPTSSLAASVALECLADRCWDMVLGTGIYRRDGAGEWVQETSLANVLGLCLPHFAVLDHEHAVAAGPNAIFVRGTLPGAAATGAAPSGLEVPFGGGRMRLDGSVLVQH